MTQPTLWLVLSAGPPVSWHGKPAIECAMEARIWMDLMEGGEHDPTLMKQLRFLVDEFDRHPDAIVKIRSQGLTD